MVRYTYTFLRKLKIKNRIWKPFKTIDRLTDVGYLRSGAKYVCPFKSVKRSGDYF